MIFGITTFTLMHVVLSLVGLIAGLVVIGAMTAGMRLDRWTQIFLVSTILANATGFFFPFIVLMPSHIIGGLSLVLLALVVVAQYGKRLAGGWRTTYVVGIVAATYFNVFVLVVQLFRRLPALIVAAPTQSEPPFAVTQALVLALFAWLGVAAIRGFRAAPVA